MLIMEKRKLCIIIADKEKNSYEFCSQLQNFVSGGRCIRKSSNCISFVFPAPWCGELRTRWRYISGKGYIHNI